ncbi:MAG: redoxin domain-containing protein [Bowdeniella nasicola]|nr:redoxin domain-containing protein [Bowdeniella nasicola]
MILAAFLSLIAGVASVLSPCVLPFLPVIIGGSLGSGSKRRPVLIAVSLALSLMIFTVLLKASTWLISVDPRIWRLGSGLLIVTLGLAMGFPGGWARLEAALGLSRRSKALLDEARRREGSTASAVATGAALGPVFNSCSPTYAWVLATVVPTSAARGFLYLSLYCLGFSGALLAISLLGRRALEHLGWAADPAGILQRTLAVVFVVVGLLVVTGADRAIQARVPSIASFEATLVPDNGDSGGLPPEDAPALADTGELKGAFPAPEFTGIEEWINSDALTMEGLRGTVVLIDFWTYSCINCERTQPFLNAWYEAYHDEGLEIVGVHAPEFAFEKERAHVERAVRAAGIRYPVALDNDYRTWHAFRNRYWPAKYLIDRSGTVRYAHFGEGEYDATEDAIRALLRTDGARSRPDGEPHLFTPGQSPETYLGWRRASGYVGEPAFAEGIQTYEAAWRIPVNSWTLNGRFRVEAERLVAEDDGARLSVRFIGQQVYLVLDGPPGATIDVELSDPRAPGGADVRDGRLTLDSARLYELVDLGDVGDGVLLTLILPKDVAAYAFTFG